MLEIKNLYVSVNKCTILNGVNLSVKKGEVHAIMGPNGSGKSTLANILSGKNGYCIEKGDILFNGKNLLKLSPEEISLLGVFLAFQYPINIPGVNNSYFLRSALNAKRKSLGKKEIDAIDFLILIKEKIKKLKMDEQFLHRDVNQDFSGGEKKANEILQMFILEPKLAILDETDSGLDIDSLRTIADGVNLMKTPNRSILLITHYQRLLNYIKPDFVHVLMNGKIIKSGDKNLALELEEKGYNWLLSDKIKN